MGRENIGYSEQFSRVVEAVSKYSRISVFRISMKYLASRRNGNSSVLEIKNAPWLVFLLIKISSQKDGKLKMNEADFRRIINLLFRLQDYLFDPDCENVLMSFRPLINQQLWIGGGERNSIMSLARQCKILGGKKKYEHASREGVGFGVTSFLIIWVHIFIQMGKRQDGHIFELNMVELLFKLQSYVSIGDFINFFVYFGIRYKDLPGYFEHYKKSEGTFEDYLYDTPLKRKPLLIHGEHIYIFSCDLIFASFPNMLVNIIKSVDLKSEFGRDVETYIGGCLTRTSKLIYSEGDLKNIYRESLIPLEGNKFPDFAIVGSDFVFVESKAVEQTDWLKVNTEPERFKKVIKEHLLKALVQCEMCAARLKSTKKFSDMSFKAIVVTHGDFGFLTAANIENFIGGNLAEYVKSECGVELVIPLEKVVYMNISDFEALTSGMESGVIDAGGLIDSVATDYLYGVPTSLKEKIITLCGGEHVYERADKILSVEDDFISEMMRFANGSEVLPIRSPMEVLVAHKYVMKAVNEYVERS